MDESLFERLRQFLATLPAGPVPPERQPELVQLLADCWDLFDGSDQEAMESYELERMEAPYWKTPIENMESRINPLLFTTPVFTITV